MSIRVVPESRERTLQKQLQTSEDARMQLVNEMEALRERAESAEARIKSVSGVTRVLLVESAFKRGVEFQKNNPSPKAKLYRDALVLMVAEAKHTLTGGDQSALRVAIAKAEDLLR